MSRPSGEKRPPRTLNMLSDNGIAFRSPLSGIAYNTFPDQKHRMPSVDQSVSTTTESSVCVYNGSSRPDPSDAFRNIVCRLSSAAETYAIWRPSGDHTGEACRTSSEVIAVPLPVATSYTHTLVPCASRSVLITATRVPSGEK